jgi:hypothetical protein
MLKNLKLWISKRKQLLHIIKQNILLMIEERRGIKVFELSQVVSKPAPKLL